MCARRVPVKKIKINKSILKAISIACKRSKSRRFSIKEFIICSVPVPQWRPLSDLHVFTVLRAAQKLNLSKRKKPQPPPPPSPPDPDEPFFYTDGFSAALQLSPPPVPPCLLRAGSKVKECPGMGKVGTIPHLRLL